MKKNTVHYLLFIFLVLIMSIINACKNTIDIELPIEQQQTEFDEIDSEFQDYLSDGPIVNVSLDSLVLSNGQSINEFLAENPEFQLSYKQLTKGERLSSINLDNTDIIKKTLWAQILLCSHAYKLCYITSYNDLWDNVNNTLKGDEYVNVESAYINNKKYNTPKQKFGLGYSFGQRDWKHRLPPPDGTCKEDAIYGLDCSGFIYNVFSMAGFKDFGIIQVSSMHSIPYWEKVIGSNKLLSDIKIEYVKNVSGDTEFKTTEHDKIEYQSGDIILWHTKKSGWSHIGIIFKDKSNSLSVFQANGIDEPDSSIIEMMKNGCLLTKGDCKSNYQCVGRGVRVQKLKFIQDFKNTAHFSVIRLKAFIGNQGNPRFNLQFDNKENVDLDLYVRNPNGEVISYQHKLDYSSGGVLDVDCLCGNCPNGPNENITWPLDKISPKGKYTFWVDYYGNCQGGSPSSNYSIYVVNDKIPKTIFKAEGTMNPQTLNPTWEYDSETGSVTKIQ